MRSGAVRVPCTASLQTRSGTGPDSATGCPAAAAQAFAGPGEGRGARAVRRGEGSAEGCDSCRRRLGRACKLRQCAYRLLAQDGRVHFAVAAHLPVGLRGDHLGRHRRAPPVAHARVAERVAEQLQPVVAAQEDWNVFVVVVGRCACVCAFCFVLRAVFSGRGTRALERKVSVRAREVVWDEGSDGRRSWRVRGGRRTEGEEAERRMRARSRMDRLGGGLLVPPVAVGRAAAQRDPGGPRPAGEPEGQARRAGRGDEPKPNTRSVEVSIGGRSRCKCATSLRLCVYANVPARSARLLPVLVPPLREVGVFSARVRNVARVEQQPLALRLRPRRIEARRHGRGEEVVAEESASGEEERESGGQGGEDGAGQGARAADPQ